MKTWNSLMLDPFYWIHWLVEKNDGRFSCNSRVKSSRMHEVRLRSNVRIVNADLFLIWGKSNFLWTFFNGCVASFSVKHLSASFLSNFSKFPWCFCFRHHVIILWRHHEMYGLYFFFFFLNLRAKMNRLRVVEKVRNKLNQSTQLTV